MDGLLYSSPSPSIIHNSTINTTLLSSLQYHTPPIPLPFSFPFYPITPTPDPRPGFRSLPTNNPLPPIKTPPQPLLPPDNLPLQNGKLHKPLAILRPNSRQPNALASLLPINQDIGTIFMPPYMRDEIYTHPSRSGIIQVPI